MGKLGYSSITLTDLTEMLPVSLVLESSLPQNIQTKIGNLYTPDLSKEGEELIITPSLFIGTEEVKTIPVKKSEEQDSNYIYYQTGDIGENGAEINYVDSSTKKDGIWVDDEGKLHYNKNLNRNITIEARINNFKNEKHNSTIALVKTTNPINILFLEEGNNNYNVVITSSGGREHFEEGNASPITLTAKLYHGTTPITEGISYKWDIITDKDTEEKNDDLDWSEDKIGTDFVSVEPSIEVERNKISSIEVFSCTITINKTGLSYIGTKILRDFTDSYTNQLIADKSLILTPNNTTVTLTNQVWYQANIINKDKYEGNNLTEEQIKENESNHNRFFYKWSLLTKDTEEIILFLGSGKGYKDYTIDLNSSFQKLDETGKVLVDDETGNPIEGNFPKENFSILGMVTIDGKTVTLNYADIKYQPVTYTINVSPKTVFVPATNSGAYRGEDNFIQKIKFQLLDDNKQPLKYDINDSGPTSLTNNNDKSSITVTRTDPNIWDFDIEFNLDVNSSNDLWSNKNSKIYEFTYVYLGNNFTEEFEVIKNYAGANGNPPSYTIVLSNNFHAFSGGEGRADLDQEVELKFSAYFGDKSLKIVKISLEDSGEEISDETEIVKGLFIKRKSTTDKVGERTYILYTPASGDNFLTENGNISFYITVEEENSIQKTFYKSFQYIINFNGKSCYLQFSENSIIYNANSKYSPNLITATAYFRETNGTIQKYENGKIRYSLDGKNWKSNIGTIIIPLSENFLINNINVELYSSQDTSWDEKYLLDKETIPILISLEGTQIGGENLIPWSKSFSTEEGRWDQGNSDIFIETEDNFNLINFFETKENTGIFSPRIILEKNYLNKVFCFSCLIYSDDWDSLGNYFLEVQLGGYLISDNLIENKYGIIGTIAKDSETLIFEDTERVNGSWQKIYKTFILNDDFFNIVPANSVQTIDNYNEINLLFYLRASSSDLSNSSSLIKIKKPKLEIGTIPTDWSPNYQDNEFLISLLENQLNKKEENLRNNIIELSNNALQVSTDDPDEIVDLYIIQELDTENPELEKYTETKIQPITITKPNPDGTSGKYSFFSVQEFSDYLKYLNETNAKKFANYSTTLIDTNLREYKSAIEIVPARNENGNPTEGYISIKTTAFTNDEYKPQTEVLKLTSDKLEFKLNGNTTAYMSNNKLFIPHGQITESLILGKDPEDGDTDSHLKIFTSDNGIGFIWEENNEQ